MIDKSSQQSMAVGHRHGTDLCGIDAWEPVEAEHSICGENRRREAHRRDRSQLIQAIDLRNEAAPHRTRQFCHPLQSQHVVAFEIGNDRNVWVAPEEIQQLVKRHGRQMLGVMAYRNAFMRPPQVELDHVEAMRCGNFHCRHAVRVDRIRHSAAGMGDERLVYGPKVIAPLRHWGIAQKQYVEQRGCCCQSTTRRYSPVGHLDQRAGAEPIAHCAQLEPQF